MVLEDIVSAQVAEKKPLYVLPLGFIYGSLALFFALWIFPAHAALLAVMFVTILMMPLFWAIVGFEKQRQETNRSYLHDLFALHSYKAERDKVLMLFVWLLLGLGAATALWYVLLPGDLLNKLFHVQLNAIREINVAISGGFVTQGFFTAVLANNIRVLTFTVLFSFIFGAGAMFILAWNASVIGVAIGNMIRTSLTPVKLAGLSAANYTTVISVSLLRYLVHGLPEILAYFVGALAGAMLSIAVVKHESGTIQFRKTLHDVGGLVLLAVGMLLIAGVIETIISPMIG